MRLSTEQRTDIRPESLSASENEFLHFLLAFRDLEQLWKHEPATDATASPLDVGANFRSPQSRKHTTPPISWSWRSISWSLVCLRVSDSYRYLDLTKIADFGEAGHTREIPQCWSWRPTSWRQVLSPVARLDLFAGAGCSSPEAATASERRLSQG
jgi:hypothetical protein